MGTIPARGKTWLRPDAVEQAMPERVRDRSVEAKVESRRVRAMTQTASALPSKRGRRTNRTGTQATCRRRRFRFQNDLRTCRPVSTRNGETDDALESFRFHCWTWQR